MDAALKNGFRVGAWDVLPLEGRLIGAEVSRRVAPRAMDVLVCLAGAAGEVVERDTLIGEVWGGRPASDEPLTRTIADLRQALGDRKGRLHYIETIPKRGYRLLLPVQARAAARAVQEDKPVARARVSKAPYALLSMVLIGVVAVLSGLWALSQRDRTPVPQQGVVRPSIVVLPLANLSADDEDVYFSDGLADTLTHVLAQIDGLRVVAQASAARFRGGETDVREIGRQLGVDAVLEGTVQRDDNTLRITTRLVATRDGTHYWSRLFDRKPQDVFAIQDEIAAAVSAALQISLLREGREAAQRSAFATSSVSAYEAFLQGRRHLAQRSSASLAAAIGDFERALSHDRSYALAWVGLADAHLLLRYYGNLPRETMVERASAAIAEALALDPEMGEAHASKGLLHWQLGELPAAEAELRRAIALEPNYSQAYFWLGTVLNDGGQAQAALEMHRAALDLDPMAPAIHNAVAVALEKLGRFDEALDQYRKVAVIAPEYAATRDRSAQLHWSALARLDEAVRLQQEAFAADPGHPISPALLAEMYLDLGDAETALVWATRAAEIGADSAWPHRAQALRLAYLDEDPGERLALARRWLGTAHSSETVEIMLRIARDVLLGRGEIAAAIALYGANLPELVSDPPAVTDRNLQAAIDLALLYQMTGADENAKRLLDAAQSTLASLPRLGCCGYAIADAEIDALRGNREAVLDALDAAVSAGWRRHWWLETSENPNFAKLANEPRFVALVARLRAATSADRARLQNEPTR